MQIVERYLHKKEEDSRHEDSENLKDIKAMQELMWQELGRRVEGFPKSPRFKKTFRRLTTAQVQFHLVSLRQNFKFKLRSYTDLKVL